jgi:hypothetical protein
VNKVNTSLVAMLAIFGTAEMASAVDTSAFTASVSVLSPDASGFIIGGQSSVNGVGSSSVVLTRSAAEMAITGGANSKLVGSTTSGVLSGVQSDAFINSALNFSRQIDTAGSLVGQGNVIATGQAIGSIGTAGAASSNTETGGVSDTGNIGAGSAAADASTQGSLNGSVSTSNTLQLLGTSGLFAGSNSLSVGEENQANAYGSATILSNTSNTGISLSGAELFDVGSTSTKSTPNIMQTGSGDGALFNVTSNLTSDYMPTGTTTAVTGIQLSVANAGNGSISLTTSTGGFFTGGGFAAGGADFSDTGAFFGAP